jgi:hypothetical protein
MLDWVLSDDIVQTTYEGPTKGEYLTRDSYEDLLVGGCSYCGNLLSVDDADTIEWSAPVGNDPAKPICESCCKQSYGVNYK